MLYFTFVDAILFAKLVFACATSTSSSSVNPINLPSSQYSYRPSVSNIQWFCHQSLRPFCPVGLVGNLHFIQVALFFYIINYGSFYCRR